MRQELIHICPELVDYINDIGFLPLLRMGIDGWSEKMRWTKNVSTHACLTEDGNGLCGNGKALCCVRAVAPMASSSSVKPRS